MADYACVDEAGGSGIDTCVGTVNNGDPIDTSTLGEHDFVVEGTDVAGNTTTVTHTYIEDGFRLGQWVNVQRTARGGRNLGIDRVTRLEKVPGWSWEPFADQWEEGFVALQRYVEREGDARVPAVHIEDGYRLGDWTKNQRGFRRSGRLTAERQARLEGVPGWAPART